MVKKGFGAGHSLTLCKAAEITRMRQTIAHRLKHVETSIDTSMPHSMHRKFDNSKGKLQAKRRRMVQRREDAVLQHRIKMLNARDPMIGEGPKYEGGSFHSPPPRASEALARANRFRTIARRRHVERLDKLNSKMAERLISVQPSEISRRSGERGWDKHWNKHAHWQATSRKRKEIMNRMINSRLVDIETKDLNKGGEGESSQVGKAKQNREQKVSAASPSKHHQKTLLLQEIHRHEHHMQKTKDLLPVLSPNSALASARSSCDDVDKVTNEKTESNVPEDKQTARSDAKPAKHPMRSQGPDFEEYKRRCGACEKMVFGPNASPARLQPVDSHTLASTLVRDWEAAKAEWEERPRGLKNIGKKNRRKYKKGHKAKSPKKRKRKRQAQNQVIGQHGGIVAIPVTNTWVNRGDIDMHAFKMPTWNDVQEIEAEMESVCVPRWHHAILTATFDPYMETDGPGWRCDVCHHQGTGLVYHNSHFDIDICIKCMNLARKLDWVQHVDRVRKNDRSTSQNQIANRNSDNDGGLKEHCGQDLKKKLQIEISQEDGKDSSDTWATVGKPNDPSSPIEVASVDFGIEDDPIAETTSRDRILFRGTTRVKGSSEHRGEVVLITIRRCPDGLLLSEDPGGSLLVDVFTPGYLTYRKDSGRPCTTSRCVITASELQNHPSIGIEAANRLLKDSDASERASYSFSPKKREDATACAVAAHLVHYLRIRRCFRKGIPHLEATLKGKIDGDMNPNTQSQSANDVLENCSKHAAATSLQKSFRGMRARNTYKGKKQQLKIDQEREIAAVSLQKTFRGVSSRRESIAKREKRNEREQAATSLQSAYRGSRVRKNNSLKNDSAAVTQEKTAQASKNIKKNKKKMDTAGTSFEGTLDRTFFAKGVYFENTRIFGTVSVKIVDLAALELVMHSSTGLSPGLLRAKSKRSSENNPISKRGPLPPKRKLSKRRASVRRRHSVRSHTDVTGLERHKITPENSGPRQLLFTVYIPTSGREFKIFVSKADIETSFEKQLATSLIRVGSCDIVLLQVLISVYSQCNLCDAATNMPQYPNNKRAPFLILQDPSSLTNRSLIETMVSWVQLRYRSIGFNKLKTLHAFMSKEYHPPIEEEAAATLVQNIWRGGVVRRQVKSHRILVDEARALIASIHECDPFCERNFLKRIAFDPEFRRAVAVMGTGSMMINNNVAHRLLKPRKCLSTMWEILESKEYDGEHAETLRSACDQVDMLEEEEFDTAVHHEAHKEHAAANATAASILEKRAACRAIFHRVDTDRSGYIDAGELVNLLENLTKELNIASNRSEISVEEARFFISSMDADGNHVIDEKEFCDFMVHGMSTSPSARLHFKERSALHSKLVILIEGLSETIERRSRALNRLYDRHADPTANNGNGGLTVESLYRLFSEAQTDSVHRFDDVQKFLMVMDEDKNGCISREEWCSYLLYGMSMTVEWRASFASRSPLHDKIVSLVEICLQRSERIHRRGVLKGGMHIAGHITNADSKTKMDTAK